MSCLWFSRFVCNCYYYRIEFYEHFDTDSVWLYISYVLHKFLLLVILWVWVLDISMFSSIRSAEKSAGLLNSKFLMYIQGGVKVLFSWNYLILGFLMSRAFFPLDVCYYHSYVLDQLPYTFNHSNKTKTCVHILNVVRDQLLWIISSNLKRADINL